MHLDTFRTLCLSLPGATEDQPFGPDVLTFKVMGKMFALFNIERQPVAVGMKCDPERSADLRERYDGIGTAPYLHKRLWHAVTLQSDVPDALIEDLTRQSYRLVVAGLTKAARAELAALSGAA